MKKILFLALAAMTMLVLTACTDKKETNNGVNNFKIQRGTNVSHWLSQSEERGEARRQHIHEDDFARLDSLVLRCRLRLLGPAEARVQG